MNNNNNAQNTLSIKYLKTTFGNYTIDTSWGVANNHCPNLQCSGVTSSISKGMTRRHARQFSLRSSLTGRRDLNSELGWGEKREGEGWEARTVAGS